jgi:hypothetical protein
VPVLNGGAFIRNDETAPERGFVRCPRQESNLEPSD